MKLFIAFGGYSDKFMRKYFLLKKSVLKKSKGMSNLL